MPSVRIVVSGLATVHGSIPVDVGVAVAVDVAVAVGVAVGVAVPVAVDVGVDVGVGMPPAKSVGVRAKDTAVVSRIRNSFVNWDIVSPIFSQ